MKWGGDSFFLRSMQQLSAPRPVLESALVFAANDNLVFVFVFVFVIACSTYQRVLFWSQRSCVQLQMIIYSDQLNLDDM